MQPYHKIHSIFKRDDKGKFIDAYSRPEFEYLKDLKWTWSEKIDGTNIRIIFEEGKVKIKGRKDNSNIPIFLYDKLQSMFNYVEEYEGLTLYGEGYGNRIQIVGKDYIKDGVSFILFDAKAGDVWLKRDSLESIARKLEIDIVDIVGTGTLDEAIEYVKTKPYSLAGYCVMEGIIARPYIELNDRMNRRIITKIKVKDYIN